MELTLSLIEPDAMTLINAGEMAREMICRYIEGKPGEYEAFPFMVGDGEADTSAAFWHHVATIVAMQQPAETLGCDPYSPEEIAAVAFTMPSAWVNIAAWAEEILASRSAEAPNAAGLPGPISSEEPTATANGTPNSFGEASPSSGVSTSASPVGTAST
jgi:hypothetical protein